MKNKIKYLAFIIIAGLMTFGVQSCEKYADGPYVSLRSREARIANIWKVENYKKNDNDYTSLLSDYTETFTKDGNYSYVWSAFNGNGTWALQNNDMEIKITGVDNQETTTLFILKLEEKSFWYYYMDGDDKKEFHMIQK
jgi:hypothetical protein